MAGLLRNPVRRLLPALLAAAIGASAAAGSGLGESLAFEGGCALERARDYLLEHPAGIPEHYLAVGDRLAAGERRAAARALAAALAAKPDRAGDRCARTLQILFPEDPDGVLDGWLERRLRRGDPTPELLELLVLRRRRIPPAVQRAVEGRPGDPWTALYAKLCNPAHPAERLPRPPLPDDWTGIAPADAYRILRCRNALQSLGLDSGSWRSAWMVHFLEGQKGNGSWNDSGEDTVWCVLSLRLVLR